MTRVMGAPGSVAGRTAFNGIQLSFLSLTITSGSSTRLGGRYMANEQSSTVYWFLGLLKS